MNDSSYLDALIGEANRASGPDTTRGPEHNDDPALYRCWHNLKKSRETGLFILDQHGVMDTLPYADFRRSKMFPPNMGIVIFTHCYLTFRGENLGREKLEQLAHLLQDQQARYIKAYNPRLFDPIEPDEPVIRELTILPRLKDDPIETLLHKIAEMA